MKKTAAVIAAGLLLAACTATQNTARWKQPRRPKHTKSRLGQTVRRRG